MVGEGATDNGAGAHHHVPSETRPRQHHDAGAEPAPVTDMHGDITRPLGVHHGIGVRISVVLVGDVDVWPGVDVVTDLEVEVADDVAAAADHAAITDTHHRIGDHLLSRNHPRRDAHIWTHQRVGANADPALTEDGAGREGQAAARPKGPKAAGELVTGPHRTVLAHPSPGAVNETVDGTLRPGGRSWSHRHFMLGMPGASGVRRRGPHPFGVGLAPGRHAPGG